MYRAIILAALYSLALCAPAQAYIGPGMAGGVVAAIFGIIGSVLLALFGILYFPIKRALKKRKEAAQAREAAPAPSDQ